MTTARRYLLIPIWALLWGLAAGCGESGRLVITLERPSQLLDPMSDVRLSKFSMRITADGRTTDHDAFRSDAGELQIGDVPVGQSFDLRLSGMSATGLMLGLGQVLDVVINDGTADTTVAVKFRKPLGYVAGQSRIQVLDAAAASSSALELAPLGISTGSAVAATPNGVLVLVVSGSKLVPMRTLDHAKLAPVSLAGSGDHVAVSPDSRYAVISHRAQKKLGVVDLLEVGRGGAGESVLDLGGIPSRVIFGRDRTRATLLVDALERGDSCGKKHGRLVDLDLDKRTYSAPRSLGRPVADVALDPRDGSMLVAMTCDKKLRRIPLSGVHEDVAVPASYDIAVADQNIALVGRASGSKVAGQAVLFDLSRSSAAGLGPPQSRSFAFPPLVISYKSQGTTSGYFTWASEAKDFKVYDLSISPDSQRAICLFQADYQSNMNDACVYNTVVRGTGYMLVDLTTGTVLVQRFTSLKFEKCHANCLINPSGKRLTDLGTCTAELKRVLRNDGLLLQGASEYEPAGSTLLFGGG